MGRDRLRAAAGVLERRAVARPGEGVARIQAERGPVLREGLVEAALRRERRGEVHVRLGKGTERDGAPVLGDGGAEVAGVPSHVAEALVAVGVVGGDGDHACPHRAGVAPGRRLPPGEHAEHERDRERRQRAAPGALRRACDHCAGEHGPPHHREIRVAVGGHLRAALGEAEGR